MKLENKILKTVLFPIFLAIGVSIVVVNIFLYKYSFRAVDPELYENIIETEKNVANSNIKVANLLISKFLYQYQIVLEETEALYKNIAKYGKIDSIMNETTIVNGYKLSLNYTKELGNRSDLETGVWFINPKITELNQLSELAYKQISIASQCIQTIYSIFIILNNVITNIYFAFDSSELLFIYPSKEVNNSGLINYFNSYKLNPKWCNDEDGKNIDYYYYKCRDWYVKIIEILNNVNVYKNKNFIVIPPYEDINTENGKSINLVFTLCVYFNDLLDKNSSVLYICIDLLPEELFNTLDKFNSKFRGYFLVSTVGSIYPFYYPKIISNNNNMALSEFEFGWEETFYLKEKDEFNSNVINLMNYDYTNMFKDINDYNLTLFSLVDDTNYFYKNGKIYNYSIHPIFINHNNINIHLLSIIYIYSKANLIEQIFTYQYSFETKLYLELGLFIYFGFILLFLAKICLKLLAKFIVIPIKNVHYMLKGINIGGENRLEYIDSLKSLVENDYVDKEINSKNLKNNEHSKKNTISVEKYNENDFLLTKSSYNEKDETEKSEKISENIEKELHFYEFDEELLQFRPKEINSLVKILLNLKEVFLLTSKNDLDSQKLINFSKSENIFYNVKNKEGSYLCQSNIGNLLSQNLNYDKAIYHLCISLQDPKLKKFLSKNISDEYDVSDSLCINVDNLYNKNYLLEKSNILVKKQINANHKTFSQSTIVNLIHNRYNKLVHIYYNFFSFLQKSNKKYEDLSGFFINSNYHTIGYYHKILIQYIFLSYASNDLIKIGESILDYLEFLIKFKLKINKDYKDILYKHYEKVPYYNEKQNIKKKYFNKIISWFDVFEHYVNYILENTQLGNDKYIIDLYARNITETNEVKNNNLSTFLFRINLQRADYLKGKFAYICKKYDDALYYFIRASKNKSIVLDGLIQKKALKHLYKVALKLEYKIKSYNLSNINFEHKEMKLNINDDPKQYTYLYSIQKILKEIKSDIKQTNEKQIKDIMIILDSIGIENTIFSNYLDEVKIILKNYLTDYDRFCLFVFDNKCRIICPMMEKNKIDIINLINYMDNYNEKRNNNLNSESEINTNTYTISNSMNSDILSSSEQSSINNEMTLKEIIDSINYCINYLLMKNNPNNENYILYFTNLFSDENEENNIYLNNRFKLHINRIKKDNAINFILICRINVNIQNNIRDEIVNNKILSGFGDKSEFINYDNMKKIKTILSRNTIINDKIIFPNEIYQFSK